MARRGGGPDPISLALVLGGGYLAFRPGTNGGPSLFSRAAGAIQARVPGIISGVQSPLALVTPGQPTPQAAPGAMAGPDSFQFTVDTNPGQNSLNNPIGMGLNDTITLYPAVNHQGPGGNFLVGVEWWTVDPVGGFVGSLFGGSGKGSFVKLDEISFSLGSEASWTGHPSSELPAVASKPPGSGRYWINAYIRDNTGFHNADWPLGSTGVRAF